MRFKLFLVRLQRALLGIAVLIGLMRVLSWSLGLSSPPSLFGVAVVAFLCGCVFSPYVADIPGVDNVLHDFTQLLRTPWRNVRPTRLAMVRRRAAAQRKAPTKITAFFETAMTKARSPEPVPVPVPEVADESMEIDPQLRVDDDDDDETGNNVEDVAEEEAASAPNAPTFLNESEPGISTVERTRRRAVNRRTRDAYRRRESVAD